MERFRRPKQPTHLLANPEFMGTFTRELYDEVRTIYPRVRSLIGTSADGWNKNICDLVNGVAAVKLRKIGIDANLYSYNGWSSNTKQVALLHSFIRIKDRIEGTRLNIDLDFSYKQLTQEIGKTTPPAVYQQPDYLLNPWESRFGRSGREEREYGLLSYHIPESRLRYYTEARRSRLPVRVRKAEKIIRKPLVPSLRTTQSQDSPSH